VKRGRRTVIRDSRYPPRRRPHAVSTWPTVLCDYRVLELHCPEERRWSWQPVASGNAGCCDHTNDYLLTTSLPLCRYIIILFCILRFFILFDFLRHAPPPLIHRLSASTLVSCVTCSREPKKKKNPERNVNTKKRFNFTRSGGRRTYRPSRIPLRLLTNYIIDTRMTLLLLLLSLSLYTYMYERVRRPFNVIHNITCSVHNIILLLWSLKLRTRRDTLLLVMTEV